jgi:lauroyl/myristoyl acyltransferase
MARDGCINLHIRDEAAPTSSFWSRDDAKFTIVAPLLVGASILCPKARWHLSARLIESISNRNHGNSSPSTTIVCERLGIAQDKLRQIITVSRVNRTEHLIHVIYSLLRKNWRPRFEITGRQYLDEALADGKGAVLWAAHFSFASLFTKMALSQAGYRISHISRPEHGVSKSRFGVRYLNRFRSAAENRYLNRRIVHLRHKPEATREAALAALHRNELLSITVGAWEGRHLATGELLGSSYTVSTGAPAFAFATGAKLLPVFTTRDNGSGDYRVVVGAPLAESFRSSREEFVRASTLELLSRHEAAVRETPEQWRGWDKLLSKP